MDKKKILKEALSKAAEKGVTPTQLVNQSIRIQQLEKKYSKSFEDIKSEIEGFQGEKRIREKTLRELDREISLREKRRSDLMSEYLLDEKNVREYVDAREKLSPMGFPVDDVSKVKTFLLSIKNENYNPQEIISKLNAIGDLQVRKTALEDELVSANADLREKKALAIEVRKVQQTGLSVEQIERLRDVISKISARRGISVDQAMSHFESDVLNNYDLALGLEGEVMRLQETKRSVASEVEEARKKIELNEKESLSKMTELETRYQNTRAEIQAYSELRASGIDGTKILALNELITKLELDYGVVMAELRDHGNLVALKDKTSKELAAIREEVKALAASVNGLKEQKQFLESSVVSIGETVTEELESVRTSLVPLVSQAISESVRANMADQNQKVESVGDRLYDLTPRLARIESSLNVLVQDLLKKPRDVEVKVQKVTGSAPVRRPTDEDSSF